MKQRIVVDTSTLVSAAPRADSKPRLMLDRVVGSFELCLSEGALFELESVLDRPKFSKYARAEVFQAFIESLREDGSMFAVGDTELEDVNPPCRDPKDNFLFALAFIAKADAIVSSDQDLLALNPWRGIPILTPTEFLERFTA